MLPFARRHQLVLHALVGVADQAEQERRVLVVEVGGLAAAQPGGVAVELKLTAAGCRSPAASDRGRGS